MTNEEKEVVALEKELGTNLFEHKHNRIVPTNEAARLSIHAKNILEEYELITDRLFKSQRTIKNVSIYCSYDFPQLMPATFFKKFHDSFPEIQINFRKKSQNSKYARKQMGKCWT